MIFEVRHNAIFNILSGPLSYSSRRIVVERASAVGQLVIIGVCMHTLEMESESDNSRKVKEEVGEKETLTPC